MNKIEPQTWKPGIDWQWPRERGEGDNGGKKGKGRVKEHVWMTHGYGQLSQGVGTDYGNGGGMSERVQGGKIGTTVIE